MDELRAVARQRLLRRREVDHVTGCWIYCGTWDSDGQGKMRVRGRVLVGGQEALISRVCTVNSVAAFCWLGIDLGTRMHVIHKPWCPNPACFNPNHLVVCPDVESRLEMRKRLVAWQRRKTHANSRSRVRVGPRVQ